MVEREKKGRKDEGREIEEADGEGGKMKIETKSFIQMKSNMMTLKNDTSMTPPVE